MANALGKRYVCETCEAQVLITKGGEGTLSCHDVVFDLGAVVQTFGLILVQHHECRSGVAAARDQRFASRLVARELLLREVDDRQDLRHSRRPDNGSCCPCFCNGCLRRRGRS